MVARVILLSTQSVDTHPEPTIPEISLLRFRGQSGKKLDESRFSELTE